MSDNLRVVMVSTDIAGDIENGTLNLSDEPTVILQGPIEAVRAAGALFGERVKVIALQAAASEVRDE